MLLYNRNRVPTLEWIRITRFLYTNENHWIQKPRTKLKQWHFSFGEKFWFEFLEISIDEWRAFSGIQEHKNNLTRCIQIFENLFYWECRPKFDFPSGIFGWMVHFSEIQ